MTDDNINILVVEDEPVIAEDITGFLEEQGYRVCENCYTKLQAFRALEQHQPDLILLDINLGKGTEGIEIANFIAENKNIPFVFLTSYTDKNTIDKAKLSHPMGYIAKPVNFNSLFSTIEIALYNFSKMLLQAKPELEVINQDLLSPITKKEFEVLLGIYKGRNNQQIAQDNFVSINTVKTHIRNIYDKLQVRSRSELLAKVRQLLLAR